MKERNKWAKENVIRRYNNVDVFCVGNIDYGGSEYSGSEDRVQAAIGSGIPDLRRFCHSLVAKAQLRAAKHLLEVEMQGLIQWLEVWVIALDQEVVPIIPPGCVPHLQRVSDLCRQ